MIRPRVLAIAGIDPCGGAGLVADARTIHVCGGDPAGIPTCTTVQNRDGFVSARATPPAELRAMLDAVDADGPIAAVKVGLCSDAETLVEIAAWRRRCRSAAVPLIVDPVLSATAGGGPTAVGDIVAAVIAQLAPLGAIVTPNLFELEQLGGTQRLLGAGCAAVVVKGGHACGDEVVDRLVEASRTTVARHARIERGPVHGTGCAFASALATALARGLELEVAFRDATARVYAWIVSTPSNLDASPVPLVVA